MIVPQFIHKLTTSFVLWADHTLLSRGFAYTNTTGRFYNYTDDRLPSDYEVFGSPHKQWVTDSSVTGATIPTGVYVNGSLVGRGNNMILDFDNGRVITSGISSSAAITGSYSVKDFNIYLSNDDEEGLVIEKCADDLKIGSDLSFTYIPPYEQKIPAIFVNTQTQKNEPFALGGMDESRVRMNMVVFTRDQYQLDGVLGLFADTSDEVFKEIPFEAAPYTENGDLKNGYYNYTELVAASGGNNFFINEASTSKATDSLRRSLKTELYIGFVDMLIGQYRNPRAN